ncbi:MAG: glycine C-acetyltransferase [Myxococcota bacterium]
MATQTFTQHLKTQLEEVREAGLYKSERVITSPQDAVIRVEDGSEVINLCANNYLGLSNHPALVDAAKASLDRYGYGMSSVRFICGTQEEHKELERRLAQWVGTEDCILYPSCFDANGGLFETLLGPEDAVISDALNHASIIDGIRLCKAKRYRYANDDMADLEAKLKEAQDARFRLIATDGVFSMDGTVANLPAIRELADRYDAMVMIDDCHAAGFMGETGAGTPEHLGLKGKIDIVTGTLGKALGGASGGYTCASAEIVDWLRQRSRPYLFSNTLAPMIAATSLRVLDLLEERKDLFQTLKGHTEKFRREMAAAGFTLKGRDHPIVPVMIGDAKLAGDMADALLEKGIFVIGFSYPVVPKGQARIRTQMSAGLSDEHVERAIAAFVEVGTQFGVIG